MTYTTSRLQLFQGYGIELEYMIVDAITLDICPIADKILTAAAGELTSDFENGLIAWSNELVLHVLEIKTNGPAASLAPLTAEFQKNVVQINQIAAQFGAKLMPSAMHPWMDPVRELQLWPHDYNPVYEAYHRIFDCRGHGWSNVQSTHINLPFANDDEFGKLHAAIRLLLPFLPALAASSPVAESHLTGFLDYRMEVYRHNSRKIPSITGRVIPEPIYTQAEYQTEIFERNYRDIAPYDTTGTLQQPFLNSRGAIARFERGAIEIRVLDVQENPGVDLAICEFISLVLQLLIQEEFSSLDELKSLPVDPLADLLVEIIRKGERTLVDAPDVLAAFGLSNSPLTVKELWQMILERVESVFDETHFSPAARAIIRKLLAQGPLARRIVNRLEGDSGRLPEIYDELCDCLHTGQMFGD